MADVSYKNGHASNISTAGAGSGMTIEKNMHEDIPTILAAMGFQQ